jgi:hypothetical protein
MFKTTFSDSVSHAGYGRLFSPGSVGGKRAADAPEANPPPPRTPRYPGKLSLTPLLDMLPEIFSTSGYSEVAVFSIRKFGRRPRTNAKNFSCARAAVRLTLGKIMRRRARKLKLQNIQSGTVFQTSLSAWSKTL